MAQGPTVLNTTAVCSRAANTNKALQLAAAEGDPPGFAWPEGGGRHTGKQVIFLILGCTWQAGGMLLAPIPAPIC